MTETLSSDGVYGNELNRWSRRDFTVRNRLPTHRVWCQIKPFCSTHISRTPCRSSLKGTLNPPTLLYQ